MCVTVRRIITIFIIPLFLLISIDRSHAEGQIEAEFEEAEQLFQDKKYNEAIIKLSEIARKNPETIRESEKRIRIIREQMNKINEKIEELIEVLDEEDPEAAAQKLRELEQLDPNPNKATQKAIAGAYKSVQLVINLKRFSEIMDVALELLEQRRYLEAFDKYLEGFVLNQEEFAEAGYGAIVTNAVDAAVQNIELTFDQLQQVMAQLDYGYEGLQTALSTGLSGEVKTLGTNLVTLLKETAMLRDTMLKSAHLFEQQDDYIRENTQKTEGDYSLQFASRLVLGRPSQQKREGIAASIELVWEDALSDLLNPLMEESDALFSQARSSFEQGELLIAQSAFNSAYPVVLTALKAQALWGTRVTIDAEMKISEQGYGTIADRLPDYLAVSEKADAIETYLNLIDIYSYVETLPSLDTTSDEAIRSARHDISEMREIALPMTAFWDAVLLKYGDMNLGFTVEALSDFAQEMRALTDATHSDLESRDIEFATMLAERQKNSYDRTYVGMTSRMESAIELKDGVLVSYELTAEDGNIEQVERTEKYPLRSRGISETVLGEAIDLEGSVEEFVQRWSADEYYVLQNDVMQQTLNSGEELLANIGSMREELLRLIKDAEGQEFLAGQYRREGELRHEQAVKALEQDRFELTKQRMSDSADAFYNSLKHMENGEVRKFLDVTLGVLQQELFQAEKIAVVMEVRTLLDNGRVVYNRGDFEQAEEVFQKALARWEDTQPDENHEITNWLTIVQKALEVQSAREIPESDPLFELMSVLLDLAMKDYLEGKQRREGEKDDAGYLVRAEEKLQNVKVAFPYNKEARVLSLQILKLKGEEEFALSLEQYFQVAVAKPPSDAYVDLKDLQLIQPDYPGLAREIEKLEVRLGIIILPPDPEDIAASKEFYKMANDIFQKAQTDLFSVALVQLDESIKLNPDNSEAKELKDRIIIATGATVKTFLSSYAQEQFRLAEQNYVKGDYGAALSIVERLLLDKKNRGYPPLLDLKKRIEVKF